MTVDFLGIGVQKGGTTWLYHQLGRHPQIAFPGGKEVHFWDRVDPALAPRWLEALQPPVRMSPDGRPIRCGEITPAYASLDAATIKALHRTCPDIRLFISLRNPLTRAWSAARMALARAQMMEHEASDPWFIDHFRSQASRRRGAYAETLTRWWAEFPRDQLLVLLLDDSATRPAEVLARLAGHLRIDAADFARLSPADLATVVIPMITARPPAVAPDRPGIRPSLLPVLRDLYVPEVERLEKLLGRNLQGWLSDPGQPTRADTLAVRCRGSGTALADSLAGSHPRSHEPL